ncbi:TAXI family TRAP transporter solute-binding subunit [Acetomicrobium sp. UBA5826]|uniref:TAXI family TRAP transporter solute-binding subunit n=1 Tax=Acetomicrobium sp. UBA5826 TaxID=1946039 RepID=UPI00257F138E|nr:TAXI family TRAP transporter solute-binding subunit [Acetomicrobium sp. UBA5826]
MQLSSKCLRLLKITIIALALCVFINSMAIAQATKTTPHLRFIGASPGGTYYIVLGGIGECVTRSLPGWQCTVEPGSSLSDVVRIAKGDGDLALVQGNLVLDQIKKGGDSSKLAALGAMGMSAAQFIVLSKTGLTSFDEFIQKKPKLRISWGPPSETHYIAAQRLFGEYGLKIEDFQKWGGKTLYKEMSDAADMIASGGADGCFLVALVPTAPISELSLNHDLTLLSMNDEVVNNLVKKYNYIKVEIPPGTYNFVKKPITTFGAKSVMLVSSDMPEEVAYNVTMAIVENLDYLKSLHAMLKDIDVKSLAETGGVPLHPGAKRAYEEAGVTF